ncbi:hypothetical protein P280DRAFT_467312 [Massarina eburnea CBS 473.64]|uniref:Uncharacterized protein n=1 Tax=Massarina eburnea CBS 473.64 TaxID=1395130 RepID=A0A6A6SAR3_9PLEO|nr:hypothetical protein P280DRAFT_467312 [Massarina eburnea CBS 473.64]
MVVTNSPSKKRASSSSAPPGKKPKKDPTAIQAEDRLKQPKQKGKEAKNDPTAIQAEDRLKQRKQKGKEAKNEPTAIQAEDRREQPKQKEKDAVDAKRQRQEASAVKKEKRQAEVTARKAVKRAEDAAKAEKKLWKQAWDDYWQQNDVLGEKFSAEPEKSINQTDAGTIYRLTPRELGCLPHFPDYNRLYKNTRKLFDEEEVKRLAFRKYAMLVGITGRDEEIMLSRGQELWEEE